MNATMSNLKIRPRQPSDLPSCASLLVRVYAKDRYPVQGVSRAEEFLSSPHLLEAWVAIESKPTTTESDPSNENIIGHVCLTAPHDEHDPAVALWREQKREQPIAVLERLFVDPEARGRGLAEKLLRAAGDEAAKRGVRAVLFALIKDPGAMRSYERVGWKEFARGMYDYDDHEGQRREMEAVCYVAPGGD